MTSSPYLDDIRAQPAALERQVSAGLPADVAGLLAELGRFDRIVMTGMGASLFGSHPAYLQLAAAGLPVWLVETAELLAEAGGLLTPRTLLWVTSQSGDSGEVAALLDALPAPGPLVLGVTNAMDGRLALAADVVLPLHAGEEHAVGTKSYVTTLAAHGLATAAALGHDARLGGAPVALERYLAALEEHVAGLAEAFPEPVVLLVGRGSSLAAAQTGGLIVKEAAKVHVEGLSAPQFRHGPLELVEPGVAVGVLGGTPDAAALNRHTLEDVRRLGGNGVWLGLDEDPPGHLLPDLGGPLALPIAEIVPLQLLSVALARRRGVEPGSFRHIGKVTRAL